MTLRNTWIAAALAALIPLGACTTNPATGW